MKVIPELISADALLDIIKDIFYPSGLSMKGPLCTMKVNLGDFCGKIIDTFEANDGQSCNLGDYLKLNCLYPSKCKLYLMTTPKELSDIGLVQKSANPERLNVNNKENVFEILYSCTQDSSYSEVQFTYSSSVRTDCTAVHKEYVEEEDLAVYNPLESGYIVKSFTVNDTVYLEAEYSDDESGEIKWLTPQHPPQNEEYKLIVHGPGEINGYNQGTLMLGVVPSCDPNIPQYTWYRENEVIAAGIGLSAIPVTQSGFYNVCVQTGGIYQLSEFVTVSSRHQHAFGTNVTVSSLENSTSSESTHVIVPTSCEQQSTKQVSSIPTNVSTFLENSTSSESIPVIVTTSCEQQSTKQISSIPTNVTAFSENSTSSESIPVIVTTSCDEQSTKQINNIPIQIIEPTESSKRTDADVVGRGSFGTVYRSTWNGTTVAVKQLNVRRNRAIDASVRREIDNHSRLRHPNIVQLMGVSFTKKNCFNYQ